MLSKERALEVFKYTEGILYWKKPTARRVKVGDVVGALNSNGYLRTQIDNQRLYIHQIIYLMINGIIPKQIDHKDGDPLNNNIENLRECSVNENLYNKSMQSNNTSGVKGVSWRKDIRKWKARISVKGREMALGVYNNLELAELVVDEAREKYHGKFARSY